VPASLRHAKFKKLAQAIGPGRWVCSNWAAYLKHEQAGFQSSQSFQVSLERSFPCSNAVASFQRQSALHAGSSRLGDIGEFFVQIIERVEAFLKPRFKDPYNCAKLKNQARVNCILTG
jgi:hypothetical protein